MALSILDGTQTATTLSTILSSGQHITAHTVVSLGTQAITDMRSAVSGSVVSIPSLPAISGTVTANAFGYNYQETSPALIPIKFDGSDTNYIPIGPSVDPIPLPISGTVTASLAGDFNGAIEIVNDDNNTSHAVAIHMYDNTGVLFGKANNPFAVSGTVTIGSALPAGTNRIGVVTIGAGTVTIGAGTAQIGSVTASISGTVTAMAGTNFSQEIYQGILTYSNNEGGDGSSPLQVNIGSALPAGTNQIGTVTASLAISATAITSGSFASLTSATLVPGNTARKMATVYNLGAGQLFVNAGASATTLGGGFMVALSSGDYFECGFTTTTLSALFASAGTASWVSH